MGEKKAEKNAISVDNVSEELIKKNSVSEDHVKKALEEIEKSKDEDMVRKAKQILYHYGWLKVFLLLAVRKSRKVEKIKLETLKTAGELEEKIKNGEMPIHEFTDELKKIYQAEADKLKEIDAEFTKLNKVNDEAYPGSWQYKNLYERRGALS